MTDGLRRAGQLSWAVVGIAALLAVLGLVAWTLRVVFPPLVLAGAIVFVLNPVVTRLQHRGVPRALGATLAYVAVLGSITAAGFLLAPLAADQARELGAEWPEIRERVERWVDDRAADSQGTFWEFTREELEDSFSRGDTTLREQLDRARDIGIQVFHVLLILFLGPIVAFYLLVDLPHIRAVAESLVPEGARDEVMHVARRLNRAIGGFFRGQLLVASIVGVMCSVGLLLIGLRFWFLVGMIAGLFNVIPLIGPWVGGVPGVVIALTTGSPLQALGVVVVMVLAQQIDNHFITPQVMHRAVQLHPAAVILALLAGGTLGGFFGLLLAVPVAAVLKILVGHVWRVHVLGEPVAVEAAEQEAADGPGPVEDVLARN
ncbi:MAG TPA: AI-2E family transporter [Acidimicrobiales bacterium]|nr:AI-2E family transporter [Acidimicrobiales bacterium]